MHGSIPNEAAVRRFGVLEMNNLLYLHRASLRRETARDAAPLHIRRRQRLGNIARKRLLALDSVNWRRVVALLDWLLLERMYIGETGEPNDTCRATNLAPALKGPLYSTRYLLLVVTVLKTLLSVLARCSPYGCCLSPGVRDNSFWSLLTRP